MIRLRLLRFQNWLLAEQPGRGIGLTAKRSLHGGQQAWNVAGLVQDQIQASHRSFRRISREHHDRKTRPDGFNGTGQFHP